MKITGGGGNKRVITRAGCSGTGCKIVWGRRARAERGHTNLIASRMTFLKNSPGAGTNADHFPGFREMPKPGKWQPFPGLRRD